MKYIFKLNVATEIGLLESFAFMNIIDTVCPEYTVLGRLICNFEFATLRFYVQLQGKEIL